MGFCETGSSRTKLIQEVERGRDGKMKEETWKEVGWRERSLDFMNTTTEALEIEPRGTSNQKPIESDTIKM